LEKIRKPVLFRRAAVKKDKKIYFLIFFIDTPQRGLLNVYHLLELHVKTAFPRG
jgi:hypothetical protein